MHKLFQYAALLAGFTLIGLVTASPARSAPSPHPESIENFWPGPVTQLDSSDNILQREWLGPLFFRENRPASQVRGFRPFYLQRKEIGRDKQRDYFLFPFFIRHQHGSLREWQFLLLGRHTTHQLRPGETERQSSTFFPFYFRGSGPEPEDHYLGILPFAGSVPNQFFHDEASWAWFPLYARLRSGEVTTDYTPFPFVRTRHGPRTRGFEIWPLFGQTHTTDQKLHRYALWPLIYDRRTFSPSADGSLHTDSHARGILPFFSHFDDEKTRDRNYLWPFFGYTENTDPLFTEYRFFWPFSVQRRGDTHYTNRWAPFYSRSIRPSLDKRWILWPLFRQRITPEREGLQQIHNQFLYFVYWDVRQHDPLRPERGEARKTHLWPLLSHWDRGDGEQQTQMLSPLAVFFPTSEVVRDLYSPLFALYRSHSHEEKNYQSRSFFFQLLTYERQARDWDVQLGPVMRLQREDEKHGFSILRGLFGYQPEEGLRLLWIPFRNQ